MVSNSHQLNRRELVQLSGVGTVLMTAGCTGLRSNAGESLEGQAVSDAEFAFQYDEQARQVTVEYTGGGQIPAGDLTVQSSAGHETNWPQLGSTVAAPDDYLEPGDTATIGPSVLNWEREVMPSETIRLIYRIDDAPSTLAQFEPGTGQSDAAFEDGFEDGDMEGWSVIRTPSAGDWSGNNDWSVTTDAIAGDHSLYVSSNGDAGANVIATDDRVIDLDRDFTFAYSWRTTDPSNRGPHFRLFDADGTDFRDSGINPHRPDDGIGLHYGGDAIDPDGSPYTDKPFRFGGSELPHTPLEADTVHTTRVDKTGDEAILRIDGEELGRTTVGSYGSYRVAFMTAGTFGSPSSMTWDDISVTYE
jgi:hypothetical protein